MRARHRHFNPKNAGATAAFDARYGITAANNTGVNTWVNRVGSNNATQTSSGNQPTFRATGGNNNSPTLEFNGTSNQLAHSIALTVAPNLMMTVARRTGGADFGVIASFTPPNTANFNTIYAKWTTVNWGVTPGDSGQSILNSWRICSAKPTSTATSNSSTIMWTDGSNEKAVTGSRYGGDTSDRRAIGNVDNAGLPPSRLQGSISQIIAIPADIGNPLRKRLEFSAAYSFKIACS